MLKNLILVKEKVINTSALDVWKTLVTPELITQYLFEGEIVFNWNIGSPIEFRGRWNGKEFCDKGVILRAEPYELLEFSYLSSFSGLPDSPENYSIITYELEPIGAETMLKLTQSNFATLTMYQHSDKNWEETLEKLKETAESLSEYSD